MTIAKQILEETKNTECQAFQAFSIAENKGESDQLWDQGATIFTFEDKSILKFYENSVELI